MGGLSRRLAPGSLVALDPCVFIYHVEAHPHYRTLTAELLRGIQEGRWQAVTSVVTLMELTVRPWQLGREDAAREYEGLIAHLPNLVLADVTRDVARWAARLRAEHRLLPADALQVATALLYRANALVTNDRDMARMSELLDVVILDDLTG
jgi:predicted nucleic acid-binding protein